MHWKGRICSLITNIVGIKNEINELFYYCFIICLSSKYKNHHEAYQIKIIKKARTKKLNIRQMTVDYLMHKIFLSWYWQSGLICCEISYKTKLVIYFFSDNFVSMYIKSVIWSIKLYEMIIILWVIFISCTWLANCCDIITSFNIILSIFERCRSINTI